jgi:hypothetical protein
MHIHFCLQYNVHTNSNERSLSRITFKMKLKPINECLSMFPSIDAHLQDYITMYSGFQNSQNHQLLLSCCSRPSSCRSRAAISSRYKNLRNYFFKLTFSRTSYQIPGHFQDHVVIQGLSRALKTA